MDTHLETVKKFYREGSTHALAGYQLIEALLKTYIGNYFEIVKSLIDDRLHFGFSRTEYEQAPMGRLLQIFAKVCGDTKLVADLRAEVPHRDHIAHQSMLIIFSKTHPTADELSKLVDKLVERNKSIGNLLERLNSAHESLIGPYEQDSGSGA